jgi:hypothetical protein
MAYTTVIVMLALIEYLYFGGAVGKARGQSGIKAPAVTGDEVFERYFRIHQNTLEQLIIFIPAIYASAYYVSDLFAVAAGVVFLIGRALYFRSYARDPDSRTVGMVATMLANLALLLGGLIGALLAIT